MRAGNSVADELAKAGALSGLRDDVDTVCEDRDTLVNILAGAARILSGWQSNAELYGDLALVSRVAAPRAKALKHTFRWPANGGGQCERCLW